MVPVTGLSGGVSGGHSGVNGPRSTGCETGIEVGEAQSRLDLLQGLAREPADQGAEGAGGDAGAVAAPRAQGGRRRQQGEVGAVTLLGDEAGEGVGGGQGEGPAGGPIGNGLRGVGGLGNRCPGAGALGRQPVGEWHEAEIALEGALDGRGVVNADHRACACPGAARRPTVALPAAARRNVATSLSAAGYCPPPADA